MFKGSTKGRANPRMLDVLSKIERDLDNTMGKEFIAYSQMFEFLGRHERMISRDIKQEISDLHYKFYLNNKNCFRLTNQAEISLCLLNFFPNEAPTSTRKSLVWFLK